MEYLGRLKFGFLLICKSVTRAFYPILLTPLSVIISSFDINHQLYADDTLIYPNAKKSLVKLQHFVMAVSAWMTVQGLS